MGKIPEKHDTLPEMLPDSTNLIIDGKLYTIDYWKDLTQEKELFTQKEKNQLNNLYQHYKAFYQKRGKKKDLEKMQKTKEIAEKINVQLQSKEVELK